MDWDVLLNPVLDGVAAAKIAAESIGGGNSWHGRRLKLSCVSGETVAESRSTNLL
jgi:hypothetical protein